MPPLLACTAEHVRRLTGSTDRQLRYWDTTGFFAPSYADVCRRRPFGRIYSFRDVVGLRTLAILRNRHKVPLQELRTVAKSLSEDEAPWASRRFFVAGRHVYFEHPETHALVAARPASQTVLPIAMHEIIRATEEDVAKLQERPAKEIGRVVRNRFVLHNAPVLAGTRVPTRAIWGFHAAGYDTDAILREYPGLQPADVEAAIAFEREHHSAGLAS